MFPDSFLISRIALMNEFFRELAFTEDEAQKFVQKSLGKKIKLEMTLKKITNSYRRFLGLPEK